jgi:radical SAM protein with 4Fe4S-binding SPASM domain
VRAPTKQRHTTARPLAASRANRRDNEIELAAQRSRLRSYPVIVDVVLTKACNFACTFCKDYETEGSARISVANFERIAEQVLPTAMRLNICSGGEPYLHAGLEEILRIAKRYNPRISIWVLSNGSILHESRIRRIIEEDLVTEHGFSVDGATAETVEPIRIGSRFSSIVHNVATLVTIRYALMRTNVAELAAAVRMWGEIGIDHIDTSYVSLANGLDRSLSLFYHQELALECFAEARVAAQQYPGLTLSLPETFDEQRRYATAPRMCPYPWQFVMIDSNGEVLPCYRAFEALRFPSVYDSGKRFETIWNSDGYRRLRATVNDDARKKFYPYCQVCEIRYGWSAERAHLGDETWREALGPRWLPSGFDHRRPARGKSRPGARKDG